MLKSEKKVLQSLSHSKGPFHLALEVQKAKINWIEGAIFSLEELINFIAKKLSF